MNTDICISIRDIYIYGRNRDISITSLPGFYIRNDRRLHITICALTDDKKNKTKKTKTIKDAQDFTSSSLYSKTRRSFQKVHNNILPCLILCSHFRPSLFFLLLLFLRLQNYFNHKIFFLILKSNIERNTCLCPLHVRTKDTFPAAIIDLFLFFNESREIFKQFKTICTMTIYKRD